jgi:hypothetical protein
MNGRNETGDPGSVSEESWRQLLLQHGCRVACALRRRDLNGYLANRIVIRSNGINLRRADVLDVSRFAVDRNGQPVERRR